MSGACAAQAAVAGRCRPQVTSARHATRCQARGGGGGGGGRRQRGGGNRQAEDVEIFNIESGWNVEALEEMGDLLGADGRGWSVDAAEDDGATSDEDSSGGWSVEVVAGGRSEVQQFSEGEYDDAWLDEEWDAAAPSSSSSGGGSGSGGKGAVATPPTFNSRVLRTAEQQLIASLPRHMLRRLEEEQREADKEKAKLKPAAMKKAAARLKTHEQLRIISGTAAGRRLRSPQGDQTRPMMEMVRNAVFNMVMSLYGCASGLPAETRWLDLFAGTGAVGIEALSRGVGECHFVEMSPWVVSNCLNHNLETCEVESAAVVHTGKAEDFLRRAASLNRFAGGAFDFMSVCPPYELVDYNELYDLVEVSPLLHEESIVIVEYPKKLAALVRPTLGPLHKLRDRRYGRTFLAIYGPAAAGAERQQSAERGAAQAARARNRLQDLLADMRAEDVEEDISAPLVTKLEWQSPLAVLPYPDPRLRAVNVRIGVFDDSLRRLAEEMFEVMYQDDGVGLAAPQVGVNVRLMVFNETGEKDKGEEIVLVNPQIVNTGKSRNLFEEGCLSFPTIYADVERPSKVRIKAQDLQGRKFTLSLTGFPARIFQHEYDHLDGTLFHDRMEPDVLATVKQQLVEMEEAYLTKNPGADIQRVA
ncbi:peptide deformylase [Micractinium conductrix]|uniref:peptide deformylase n=1 Tax=Micractinium conductrix TaxID=554055 RepID=A0A2P6VQD0_9CHLO|nr:peptide deformylase [Micractinium conductrix]|eukprot:PSC76281.1 peptide deformylase [Micractinium conductrix]